MASPLRGADNGSAGDCGNGRQPYLLSAAARRAPNVLYVVWDDAGIATWDAFGGLIETPNMAWLAARGLRYSQWHTSALSSPTRTCLLTGRSDDADGMARTSPGGSGRRGPGAAGPPQAGTLAEILAENGYRTYCVGKWHLSPPSAPDMAEPRETWPLRRGFDRYYGFLGEATSQWDPDLIYDNQHVDPPYLPADGYHLSADLVGMAVEFIRDGAQAAPGQPWLCYLSFGATGIPQSAPREWTEMYRGRFDAGYDHYREIVLENMRRLRLVPDSTELTPAGRRLVRGPAARAVRSWLSLSDDQKQLSSRLAESSAGLCSYTDHQVGRLLRYLEESGQLADTIVVACSANATGASGSRGGPPGGSELFASGPGDTANGSWHGDLTGTAGRSLCSAGWERAFRMPYNTLSRSAPGDSVASPLIISSAPDMRHVAGGVRDQYHHAVDIVPTILDCAGADRPQIIKGHAQQAMHGVSMRYSFTAPDEPSVWLTQRCDMPVGQAICQDGGKAVAGRRVSRDGSNGAAGARELYHVAAGRAGVDEEAEVDDLAEVDEGAEVDEEAEVDDLAARYPQEAAELASLWAAAAPGGGEAQDDRVAG